MLNLIRVEGQAVVIETPTGAFTILVKEANQDENRLVLELNAEWMPGHADVTLQFGGSVSPQALAGLTTIHFQRWDRKGRGRVALGVEAPRDWLIRRAESLSERRV